MSALTTAPNPVVGDADRALTVRWRSAVQPTAGLPFVARDALAAASDLVEAAAMPGRTVGEHVHLANAYSVALADSHRAVADLFTDRPGWLLPDGRPLVWLSALRRDEPRLRQVRGPQFMLDVADLGRGADLKHYLLGGSPETLAELERNLLKRFPGVQIVGAFSPPFRPASEEELRERDEHIRGTGAQVVWVGLGTPKQDVEVVRLAKSLPVVAVAVGAAFDYAAGSLRPAPHWVSVIGFEWLWRFAAEPRRLWKRYTVGNARFIRAAVVHEVAARLRPRRGPRRTATTVVGQLPPPLHGSAVMTQRLIETLQRQGETVRVVDRRFSRSVDEVGRADPRKLLAIPSLVRRFAVAARRSDRTVLLLTSSPASFLIDHALLRLTRKPVVLYVHTVGFERLAGRGRVWGHLVRRTFERAAAVVVLGESLRADVAPFTGASPVEVVPNTTPAVRAPRHEPGHCVLFLANLLPGKGADVFVRVAAELLRLRPDLDWRFDLAGAGDATALGRLPDGVTVHGRVTGEAKDHLLQQADVMLVPSTYAMEAQPLVIVEALSFGLPVVAYDTGGIRDLVDESVGALVPAGDETAMAEAVLQLLESSERRTAASAAARLRFEQRHSPRAFAAAWRDVLAGRGSGRASR